MNTTEKIVESYYRIVNRCFTIPDQKVLSGNNRQLDLLAVNMTSGEQYHVEVSVKNDRRWSPDADTLRGLFDKKYLGMPREKTGANTDWEKGKHYRDSIFDTYRSLGLNPDNIQRVWVSWIFNGSNDELSDLLDNYSRQNGFPKTIQFLSFQDSIIPDLLTNVQKSYYEDDSLRTLSLIKLHLEAQQVGAAEGLTAPADL